MSHTIQYIQFDIAHVPAIQIPSSFSTVPFGHTHMKLPTVFMQNCTVEHGEDKHSLISNKEANQLKVQS